MSFSDTAFSPIRLIHFLPWLLCCYINHVAGTGAGVQFTRPPGGETLPSGPTTIQWIDGGGIPGLVDLTTYSLQLIVGGNAGPQDSKVIQTLVKQGNAADGQIAVNISASTAQSIQNGFYLRMESTTSNGTQVINYSGRFTLIQMTGHTPAVLVQGAAAYVGNDNVPTAQIVDPPERDTPPATVGPSAPAQTTLPDPASSSPSPSSSNHLFGLNSGTTIAVAIGGVLVGFGLVALGWGIWMLNKRRRIKRERDAILLAKEETALADKIELPVSCIEGIHVHAIEEAGQRANAEVEGSPVVHELEGDMGLWELSAARRSQRHSRNPDSNV